MKVILSKLAKIANQLDQKEQTYYSDRLDSLLKSLAQDKHLDYYYEDLGNHLPEAYEDILPEGSWAKEELEEEGGTPKDKYHEEIESILDQQMKEDDKSEFVGQMLGTHQPGFNERKLIEHNIFPISEIKGEKEQDDKLPLYNPDNIEESKIGKGKLGTVYKAVYQDKEVAAKVTKKTIFKEQHFNDEIYVWKKILEIKPNLSLQAQKHLPEIYKLIEDEDRDEAIIVMEKLEPVDEKVLDMIFPEENKPRNISYLFKDPSFMYDVFKKELSKWKNRRNRVSDYYSSRSVKEMQELEKAIVSYIPSKKVLLSNANSIDFEKYIREDLGNYLNLKNVYIDSNALYVLARSIYNRFYLDIPDRHYSAIKLQRENLSQFKDIPEMISLLNALEELNANGIQYQDLHDENIMQRPGSKELVLIDVGLYDAPGKMTAEEFENQYF